MKRKSMLLLASMAIAGLTAFGQQQKNLGQEVFVEASARQASPTVAVFAFPNICDLMMLTTERTDYGPFEFYLPKDVSKLSGREFEISLENCQTRALQKACKIADNADLIIEPMFTSTIYDKEQGKVFISLSGYPAKYTNFRKLTDNDLKTVETLYPNGVYNVNRHNEGRVITTTSEEK